jgi:putative selenium metabolism protein SsnA
MTRPIIISNGVVVTGNSSSEVIENGAVVCTGERITAVGVAADLCSRYTDAEPLDAGGGLILPGLINLHHHFYSALARGLDPGSSTRSFGEVLERLWWRLDRALDPETVRLSALISAADCIRWGCTTVFDHHASPSCLRGSLDLIAEVLETAGLSGVLCYEVSDRNGHGEALAGIEENFDFVDRHKENPRIRGMLGLHASFTVSDSTLEQAAGQRSASAGCHIHIAEDPIDVTQSLQQYGATPVQRLQRFELLDEHAILAHGVHLGPDDLTQIAESGAVLVHNPESNANNGVGRLDLLAAAGHGCLIGLGTDGMSSAMLGSLRAAFLAHRAGSGDPSQGFEVLPELLSNNAAVARRFFDEPLLGTLAPGAPADILVVDAQPPTPISTKNLFGHLVYGAAGAPVRHTIARGRVLLRDHNHTTMDPTEIAVRARRVSPQLWQRFSSLE